MSSCIPDRPGRAGDCQKLEMWNRAERALSSWGKTG